MPEQFDYLAVLAQLPVVGIFAFIMWKFLGRFDNMNQRMTDQLTGAIKDLTEKVGEEIDSTKTLHREVKELRNDLSK